MAKPRIPKCRDCFYFSEDISGFICKCKTIKESEFTTTIYVRSLLTKNLVKNINCLDFLDNIAMEFMEI